VTYRRQLLSDARPKIEPQSTIVQPNSSSIHAISWASLAFAALQSVCTALIALSGIRFAIGLGSLILAAGVTGWLSKFHADKIRIPMMLFALFGACLNLFVLWHARRLRERPSAQWRRQPTSPRKKRGERIQVALAVLTLVLLVVEESIHIKLHGL
jgi:cytochrome b subunit of formate dehydrogenase